MPRGTSASIKSFYGGTTRSREACLKCSLLEKKNTGDSARARTTVLYIYIPVSSSLFPFILKSKIVLVHHIFSFRRLLLLLLFLKGVVVLFHTHKKITSFEKRESLSSVCRFPNKERKGKKRPFKIFFVRSISFLPHFCHKTRHKNTTSVDKGERTGDDDDDDGGEDDEEKARDVF